MFYLCIFPPHLNRCGILGFFCCFPRESVPITRCVCVVLIALTRLSCQRQALGRSWPPRSAANRWPWHSSCHANRCSTIMWTAGVWVTGSFGSYPFVAVTLQSLLIILSSTRWIYNVCKGGQAWRNYHT